MSMRARAMYSCISAERLRAACSVARSRYQSEVTVTFLTLAFAQLFHVFNMRHPRSDLLRNEITRNPWLWASLLMCAVLLAVPSCLPPAAHILHLVSP